MTWSIADVARMSGVTARTLRHYDDIGLLRPARVGANGYRYYDQDELLRLQQILLLRELGLGLAAIARILAGEDDRIDALRRHHRSLLAERDRLHRLADTVAKTIARLEEGTDMPAEEMFDGFTLSPEIIDDLERRSIEREGEQVRRYYDEIRENTAGWTPEQFAAAGQDARVFEGRVLEHMRAGTPVDDPAVRALMAQDFAAQQQLCTLDPDSYAQLGRAFADSPELRAHLDEQDPHLAEYLRDAMVAYAGTLG